MPELKLIKEALWKAAAATARSIFFPQPISEEGNKDHVVAATKCGDAPNSAVLGLLNDVVCTYKAPLLCENTKVGSLEAQETS